MTKRKKNQPPPPPRFTSSLIENIERLQDMHPSQYTIEDLCEIIGQQMNLGSVTPIAIGKLRADPLSRVGLYTGELLRLMLNIDQGHWRNRQDQKTELRAIIESLSPEDIEELIYMKDDIKHWLEAK
jgi:hypothetical protein